MKALIDRLGWLIAGMLCIILVLSAAQLAGAGPLDPSAPPASTMKTLGQLLPSWSTSLSSSGGCASERFSCVLGNQAALDAETGLVWQLAPNAGTTNWAQTQLACNTATTGDRGGWRLPTQWELSSLRDPAASSPALPAGHPFTIAAPFIFWTSNSEAGDAARAVLVDLGTFGATTAPTGIAARAWCVRSPTSASSVSLSDPCPLSAASTISIGGPGSSGSLVAQSNVGCGVEAGEPVPSCVPSATHSKWYVVQVPMNTQLTLTATPTSAFDVAMAWYSGNTFATFFPQACINSAGSGVAESRAFGTAGGLTILYLRIDGVTPADLGTFNLSWVVSGL